MHDKALKTLSWADFTPEEMALLPTVLTMGGDGATYDIGFGALSRLLASDTPVKVARAQHRRLLQHRRTGLHGEPHRPGLRPRAVRLRPSRQAGGPQGARPDRGLPPERVRVLDEHRDPGPLPDEHDGVPERYQTPPAVLDVYTPCGSEHGIPEEASPRRARLAVESRMNPVFVHDPRRGTTLHDWFSLDGNPDVEKTWTTTRPGLPRRRGELQLMEVPLTPAEFALGETRFRKQFKRLAPELEDVAVPIDEYVELTSAEQAGKVPFVYATDENQRLIKVECSSLDRALVEDRRRNWQILQYLSGAHEAKLTALHTSDLADLRARYEQAMRDRESSIDDIAEAMSSLATSSRAPVGVGSAAPGDAGRAGMPAAPAGPAPRRAVRARSAPAAAPAGRPVHLGEEDIPKCNDCNTCYQELPQLFEPHSIVIDGSGAEGRPDDPRRPGQVELTPELLKRIDRVKKTCDAEIIQ